jgi:hypothetical protein
LESTVDKKDLLAGAAAIVGDLRPAWLDTTFKSVEAGQIWFTRGTFNEGSFGYEGQHRVPVLVLRVTERDSGRWLEVVPVWTDTENATLTDLLLREDHTTVGCELRLLFRLQGWLAERQLDSGIGTLSSAGGALVDAVLAGDADNQHFGAPAEGSDDPRLKEPGWMAPAVRMAQSFYLFYRENRELVQEPVRHDLAESKVIPLNVRWVTAMSDQPNIAWAASTNTANKEMQAEIRAAWGHFTFRLRHDIFSGDQLRVGILEVKGIERPVRLLVRWSRGEPILSDAFVPREGEELVLARAQGVLLGDIAGIDLLTN